MQILRWVVLGWSTIALVGQSLVGTSLGDQVAQNSGHEAQVGQSFVIEVCDEATGRGIPMVEVRTTNHLRFFTDSAGLVALNEPDFWGETLFFHLKSDGYTFPADGFDYRGAQAKITPGGKVRWNMQRVNVAERLYRVTGAGIYRDSMLAGREIPLQQPALRGGVVGCDSVLTAEYQGQLYWFWGDIARYDYPLGGFHMTGATSSLDPQTVQPEVGVDLKYFIDDQGLSRPMAPMPGDGPTWLGGLAVLRDAQGQEQMLAGYAKIRPPLEAYEKGLVRWNNELKVFEQHKVFDFNTPVAPQSQDHTFLHTEPGGEAYLYFCRPLPLFRVPATAEAYSDLEQYETYTCLKTGSRIIDGQIDRDEQGKVRYAWRRNTPPLAAKDEAQLISQGKLQPHETLLHLSDVETGDAVMIQAGSVYWNAHRQRWVLIAGQLFGKPSVLGELWFAEAESPTGPWAYARKIVTHESFSFYNPKHHPYFDQENGRILYFEGTLTELFSGNPHPNPRYEYNQIMYRLDLDDLRLNLPRGVGLHKSSGPLQLGFTAGQSQSQADPEKSGTDKAASTEVIEPEFFALAHPASGTVGVFQSQVTRGLYAVAGNDAQPPEPKAPEDQLLFYGLSPEAGAKQAPSNSRLQPIWQQVSGSEAPRSEQPQRVRYVLGSRPLLTIDSATEITAKEATATSTASVDTGEETVTWTQQPEPIAWVWSNPHSP